MNIAILGATGLIGRTMLEILEQREFPVDELFLLASGRSAGETLGFRGRRIDVIDAAGFDWSRARLALFSAGSEASGEYAPRATAAGCVVIDNSARFRGDADVPLVVPEVNPGDLAGWAARRIVANPNCSTIQLVMVLKPLHDIAGLERVSVATYQSVSGAGQGAIDALARQTARLLNAQALEPDDHFPVQIAFNLIPHIDEFVDNGHTREEMKIVNETRRILDLPGLRIGATAVRVPVFHGHSEAVGVETRTPMTPDEARQALALAAGVVLVDVPGPGGYPTPATHAARQDGVFVGRVRPDLSTPGGLCLWVVADNVRKGGALNAVQIAEALVKSYL